MTKKKKPEELLKRGRPTGYTKELAQLICDRVATTTFGLARMCEIYDDLPTRTTVNEWRYKFPEFASLYARAKLRQADLLAEETLEIADNAKNDWMASFGKDGETEYKLNGEHVQRSRLRIDTRKFLASKLLPRQYGDKIEIKTDLSSLTKEEKINFFKELSTAEKMSLLEGLIEPLKAEGKLREHDEVIVKETDKELDDEKK